MSFHPQLFPRLQLLFDVGAHFFRLQPQRVAAKVNARPTVRARRDMEVLAEARERISGVHRHREVLTGAESFRDHYAPFTGVNSRRINSSARCQSKSSI